MLLLNVTGLNSAVKRTCVLEYLHRKSISGALICSAASSGIFLHVFWECPVVMDLWTHVDLVLSSSLRTDCFANTSVCLLDVDSGLSISLIQRRGLFAGFAAVGRTMMQNWCAPHVCGEAYWIAYYYYFISIFFSNICDYIKEGPVLLLFFPSLSLSPLIGPLKYVSEVCVCCLVLFVLSGCYVVMLCVKKKVKSSGYIPRIQSLTFNRILSLNMSDIHLITSFQKFCIFGHSQSLSLSCLNCLLKTLITK